MDKISWYYVFLLGALTGIFLLFLFLYFLDKYFIWKEKRRTTREYRLEACYKAYKEGRLITIDNKPLEFD